MRFFVTSDSNSETGVGEANSDILILNLMDLFKPLKYGEGLSCVSVIFMCRSPELIFKRRIRHSKIDKVVSMDIMLDYYVMVKASHEERVLIMLKELMQEVPKVLNSKKIVDFDKERFISDLRTFIGKLDCKSKTATAD